MPGRFAIFTGVDDLVLESAILGIDGWVAGSGIAVPAQNQYFWELTRAGEWDKAREFYRWFAPLLHLDTNTKFVQYIKLAVQECGLGHEWVRAPRLTLAGDERKCILKIIHDAIALRPAIPKRRSVERQERRSVEASERRNVTEAARPRSHALTLPRSDAPTPQRSHPHNASP